MLLCAVLCYAVQCYAMLRSYSATAYSYRLQLLLTATAYSYCLQLPLSAVFHLCGLILGSALCVTHTAYVGSAASRHLLLVATGC